MSSHAPWAPSPASSAGTGWVTGRSSTGCRSRVRPGSPSGPTARVKAAYGRSIDYSLASIVSFVAVGPRRQPRPPGPRRPPAQQPGHRPGRRPRRAGDPDRPRPGDAATASAPGGGPTGCGRRPGHRCGRWSPSGRASSPPSTPRCLPGTPAGRGLGSPRVGGLNPGAAQRVSCAWTGVRPGRERRHHGHASRDSRGGAGVGGGAPPPVAGRCAGDGHHRPRLPGERRGRGGDRGPATGRSSLGRRLPRDRVRRLDPDGVRRLRRRWDCSGSTSAGPAATS